MKYIITITCFFIFLQYSTPAATYTWTGSYSSGWFNAANWNLGAIPGSTDDAVIVSASYDPMLTSGVTINNLSIDSGAVFIITAHSLTVTGTFSNEGSIVINGDETVSLTNDYDSGLVVISGTPISCPPAALATAWNMIFSGTGTFVLSEPITVYNTLTIASGKTLDPSTCEVNVKNLMCEGTFDTGTGNHTISGNITVPSGGAYSTSSAITYLTGTDAIWDAEGMSMSTGTIQIDGSGYFGITNLSDLIISDNASVTLTRDVAFMSSSTTIGYNATLNLNGHNFDLNSGPLTNNGTMIITDGSTYSFGSFDSASGTVRFDFSTPGPHAISSAISQYYDVEFFGNAQVYNEAGLTVNNSVTLNDNIEFSLSYSSYFNGSITIHDTASLINTSEAIYFEDGLVISTDSSGILNFDTGISYINGSITLDGTMAFYDLECNSTPATIAVEPSCSLTVSNDLTITGTPGNEINLRSTVPGMQFVINRTGGNDFCSYADILDCAVAPPGRIIEPDNSIDSGNNLGWGFLYLVTDPADSGDPGTLRTVITDVGPSGGVIEFDSNISIITLSSDLPVITTPNLTIRLGIASSVLIDGNTSAATGIHSQAPKTIITGINFAGFTDSAVKFSGSDSYGGGIYGCEIGNITGSGANYNGVAIINSAHHITIGHTDEITVISGNTNNAIHISDSGYNVVKNTVIGLDGGLSGNYSSAIGIYVSNSTNNIIGTNRDNVDDDYECNYICNCNSHGIYLYFSDNNLVSGNYCGNTGTASDYGNKGSGIYLYASSFNEIGCNSDGIDDEFESNRLCWNHGHGLQIDGSMSSTNVVRGNLIGIEDAYAATPAGNHTHGIAITGGSSGNIIGVVSDETAPANAGNIIGGQIGGAGIFITGSTDSENWIGGNIIGVNKNVSPDRVQNFYGIVVTNTAYVVIGTNLDAAADIEEANVITGNVDTGILLSAAYQTTIHGNRIGLQPDGNPYSITNNTNGIVITNGSTQTALGNPLYPDSVNIISGSEDNGIVIKGISTMNNVLGHNYIGCDATGTDSADTDLHNDGYGILITGGSRYNNIGVAAVTHANIISGSGLSGIHIANSPSNKIQNNLIGLTKTSDNQQKNTDHGIYLQNSGYTIIGTDDDGTNDNFERNIITNNGDTSAGNISGSLGGSGIYIEDSDYCRISGNFVGLLSNGTYISGSPSPCGNEDSGIYIYGDSTQNLIGMNGTESSAQALLKNIISFNNRNSATSQAQICIDGAAIPVTGNNTIAGNWIGIENTGNSAGALSRNGILLLNGALTNTVGTNADGIRDADECNYICFLDNSSTGIAANTSSHNNFIRGNAINRCPDMTTRSSYSGTSPDAYGIIAESNNNVISENKICNLPSMAHGIYVTGAENHIFGNTLDSCEYGIHIAGGSAINNIVGLLGSESDLSTARNRITNGTYGIKIENTSSGIISGNVIGQYATGGIAGTSDSSIIVSNSSGIIVGSDCDASTTESLHPSLNAEGNIVTGSTSKAVFIENSSNILIRGNVLGMNSVNSSPTLGNETGIFFTGSVDSCIVGVSGDEINPSMAGNYIVNSDKSGIQFDSTSSMFTDIRIAGNHIGIEQNDSPRPNGKSVASAGIEIQSNINSPLIIGTNGDGLHDSYEKNIISGNIGYGITISDCSVTPIGIYGNFIGTNSSGSAAVANTLTGIYLLNCSNIRIGPSDKADASRLGNIVSGNGAEGIESNNCSDISVDNNKIGTDINGFSAIANNGTGILFSNTSSLGKARFNTVAYNNGDGIQADNVSSILFSQNSIFQNAMDGISLKAGANANISAPVLIAATAEVSTANIVYLTGTSPTGGTVEVFKCQFGDDEGKVFLGSFEVTTASFYRAVTLNEYINNADLLTATFIQNGTKNTSAFCIVPIMAQVEGDYIPQTYGDTGELIVEGHISLIGDQGFEDGYWSSKLSTFKVGLFSAYLNTDTINIPDKAAAYSVTEVMDENMFTIDPENPSRLLYRFINVRADNYFIIFWNDSVTGQYADILNLSEGPREFYRTANGKIKQEPVFDDRYDLDLTLCNNYICGYASPYTNTVAFLLKYRDKGYSIINSTIPDSGSGYFEFSKILPDNYYILIYKSLDIQFSQDSYSYNMKTEPWAMSGLIPMNYFSSPDAGYDAGTLSLTPAHFSDDPAGAVSELANNKDDDGDGYIDENVTDAALLMLESVAYTSGSFFNTGEQPQVIAHIVNGSPFDVYNVPVAISQTPGSYNGATHKVIPVIPSGQACDVSLNVSNKNVVNYIKLNPSGKIYNATNNEKSLAAMPATFASIAGKCGIRVGTFISGVSGVTIDLYDGRSVKVASTTTDGSGFYTFSNIAPKGLYSCLARPPAGYRAGLRKGIYVPDGTGETVSDQNIVIFSGNGGNLVVYGNNFPAISGPYTAKLYIQGKLFRWLLQEQSFPANTSIPAEFLYLPFIQDSPDMIYNLEVFNKYQNITDTYPQISFDKFGETEEVCILQYPFLNPSGMRYTISGKCQNKYGEPVEDVKINAYLDNRDGIFGSATSGKDGYYQISLESGKYRLESQLSSNSIFYNQKKQSVSVNNDINNLDFLFFEGGKITGTVLSANGAVPNVRIIAEHEDFETEVFSNSEGKYTLSNLKPGSYFIYADGLIKKSIPARVIVQNNAMITRDITIEETGTVVLNIKDTLHKIQLLYNSGIGGVDITFYRVPPFAMRASDYFQYLMMPVDSMQIFGDGTVEVNLPAGEFMAYLTPFVLNPIGGETYTALQRLSVHSVVGEETFAGTFDVDPVNIGSSIYGQILSAGYPVNDAVILLLGNHFGESDQVTKQNILIPASAFDRFAAAISDPQSGTYAFPSVQPGDYTVIVAAKGYGVFTQNITVKPDERKMVNINTWMNSVTLNPREWNMFTIPIDFGMGISKHPADFLKGITAAELRSLYGLLSSDTNEVFYRSYAADPEGFMLEKNIGYWIYLNLGSSFEVAGPLPDLTAENIPEIELHGNWNLIGNPYPFALSVEDIVINIGGNKYVNFETSGNRMTDKNLWFWKGASSGYQAIDKIGPWQGAWIYAYSPCKIVFLPNMLIDSEGTAQTAPKKSLIPAKITKDPQRWMIQLAASCKEYSDTQNYIGIDPDSVDSIDPADEVEPPKPVSNSIQIFFPHTNYTNAPLKYAVDMRSVFEQTEGREWDMVVQTSLINEKVRVTWPDITQYPDDYSLELIDEHSGEIVNMKDTVFYEYIADSQTHKFKVIANRQMVGTSGAVNLSKVDIYPIPVTDVMTIRYTVSGTSKVKLSIYDIAGDLVFFGNMTANTNPAAATAENFEYEWNMVNNDGDTVANGVYIVKIRAESGDDEVDDTRKIAVLQ